MRAKFEFLKSYFQLKSKGFAVVEVFLGILIVGIFFSLGYKLFASPVRSKDLLGKDMGKKIIEESEKDQWFSQMGDRIVRTETLASSSSLKKWRVVFLEDDSEVIPLIGISKDQPQVVKGEEKILLPIQALGKIRKGDFVLLSDATHSDLLRVTETSFDPQNQWVSLEHRSSLSHWNPSQGLSHEYGSSSFAFVQKVGLQTFSLDLAMNRFFQESHHRDDDFDDQTLRFKSHPKENLKS